MAKQPDRIELVYGSLDMLILRTLRWGPTHGHGIAKSIERMSEDALRVEHGSLYPALQRLQQEGWISAEWGVSKNNQRAKYYRLTAAGRAAIGGRDLALGALCAGHYRRSAPRRARGRVRIDDCRLTIVDRKTKSDAGGATFGHRPTPIKEDS